MLPRFGEWDERYRARGLAVVGVHSPETDAEADDARVAEFVRRRGIRWRVVLDPYLEAFRRFGVDAWPTLLLIDRRGIVRAVHVGEDGAAGVERQIAALLAEPEKL